MRLSPHMPVAFNLVQPTHCALVAPQLQFLTEGTLWNHQEIVNALIERNALPGNLYIAVLTVHIRRGQCRTMLNSGVALLPPVRPLAKCPLTEGGQGAHWMASLFTNPPVGEPGGEGGEESKGRSGA